MFVSNLKIKILKKTNAQVLIILTLINKLIHFNIN